MAKLGVTEDFAGSGNLTIDGLQLKDFSGASPPTSLELWLASERSYQVSANKLRIGKPTLHLAQSQVFVVRDLTTDLSQLTIREDTVAAGITAGRDIRIVVPAEMEWDTGMTKLSLEGALQGRASNTVTYPDKHTLLIDVIADFSAGEALVISGLKLTNFNTSLRPARLRLRANARGADNALSDSTVAIAQPKIASDFNQGFAVGDSLVQMAPIAISEDSQVAGITAVRDIQISIPDSRVLRWSITAEGGLKLEGSGAGKVNTAILDDSTLVLDVESDFSPGEVLIISGLNLLPTGLLPRSRLRMSLNGGRSVNAEDSAWIEVGAPTIYSERDNLFDFDEDRGSLARISIQEHAAAAGITSGNDIRIAIPEISGVRWGDNPSATSILLSAKTGNAAGKVANTAQIGGASGRELLLDVTESFEPGDGVSLTGLPVYFEGVSPAVSLQLLITPGVDAVDTATVRVGDPDISALVDNIRDTLFVAGDPGRELPPIQIQEHPEVAIVNRQDGILITLPPGFNGGWKNRAGDSVRFTGRASSKLEPLTTGDYQDAKALHIRVVTDFEAGDDLQITGLAVDTLKAASVRDSLRISVLGVGRSESIFPVQTGAPSLLSAADQSFVAFENGQGDGVEEAAPFTIKEDNLASSIISREEIHLIIPDTLAMEWVDPSSLALSLSGPAARKLINPSLANPKTLLFSIAENFVAGDFVTISGLRFQNFASVSRRERLLFSATAGFSINARDDRTKRIGNPKLSSGQRQRFIAGISDTLFSLTIAEDEQEGAIDTSFVLEIPPDLDARWDPAMNPVIAGDGVQLVTPVEEHRLRFRVDPPREGGQTITLKGLRFLVGNQPSGKDNLRLSVNGGIDDRDDQVKWIGGRPSISLSEELVLVAGDPDTLIEIVVQDTSTIPSIIPEDGLILALPENSPVKWRLEEIALAGSAAGKVGEPGPQSTAKLLFLPVREDFIAGDALVIRVKIGEFLRASLDQGITLSALADTARHKEQTAQTFRIGQPRISATEKQAFVAVRDDLSGPVPSAPIQIVEHPEVSSITAKNGIRISIPDTLSMSWVGGDTTAVRISGSAAARFSDTVLTVSENSLGFEGGGKTVYLPVKNDFLPGDSLFIEGLRLGRFERPSRRAPLLLSVNGGRSVNAMDTIRTKQVGSPRLSSTASQRFQVGEEGILMAPVVIAEDTVESAIGASRRLEVRLNPDLGDNFAWMQGEEIGWDGSAKDKIDSLSITEDGKALLIKVKDDFAPGDTLKLSGLRCRRIGGVAEVDSLLHLSVNGGIDAKSPEGIKIGSLSFFSDSSQVFRVNDPPGEDALFTLAENEAVALLAAGDSIHFRIPQTASFRWVSPGDSILLNRPRKTAEKEAVTVGDPLLSPSRKAGGPFFSADRKTVSFVIFEELGRGESLQISRLYLRGFEERSSGNVTLTASIARGPESREESDERFIERFQRRDANSIRVALPALSSAGLQTFLVGDPAIYLIPLELREDPDTSSVRPEESLHLFIPDTLAAQWDTTQALLDIPAGSKLNREVRYMTSGAGRIDEAVITLNAPLEPDERIAIKGLALREFSRTSPDGHLSLSLNSGQTINIRDERPKRIGNLVFTARDTTAEGGLQDTMVFLSKSSVDILSAPGDAYPVKIYPVRITENDKVATLLPGDIIHIAIPDSFKAHWADSQNSLQIRTKNSLGIDYGATKVSAIGFDSTGYEFLVESEVAPGDTIEIQGLLLDGFEGAAASSPLVLHISNENIRVPVKAVDDSLIGRRESPQRMRIGSPRVRSTADQVFAVGDAPTPKFSIAIVENDTAAAIVNERDLRIAIPEGLGLKWDEVLWDEITLAPDSMRSKIEVITYEDSFKILRLHVSRNFAPGDSLIIDGLRVREFSRSSSGSLSMWPIDERYPVRDPAALYVGAPHFYSAADQIFVEGDVITPVYPITVVEDSMIATIRAGGKIRIVLPAALTALWDSSATELSLDGNALEKVNKAARFSGDTLAIDVLDTFVPGDTLKILAGLRLQEFHLSPRDTLRMSVTTAGIVHAADRFAKWVGRPAIRSEKSVAFPLDSTPAMGDRRGKNTPPVTLAPIHITENDTASSTKPDTDILLTFAKEAEGLKPFVEWDISNVQAILVRGRRDLNKIDIMDSSGDTLRIDIDEPLEPGDEVQVSGLGLKAKEQVYAGDLGRMVEQLPQEDFIGLIVHGIRDSLEVGGVSIANPNRSRIVGRDIATTEVFLPVMFDDPRIFTASSDTATWVAFHSIPEFVDSTSLKPRALQIYRSEQEDAALFDSSSATPIVDRSSRLTVEDHTLSLWEIKIPLSIRELRQLNRWFDDSSLGQAPTNLEMRVLPQNGLKVVERNEEGEAKSVAVKVRDEDAENSHRVWVDYLDLVSPEKVRFQLEARYFNPLRRGTTKTETIIDSLELGKSEDSELGRAVLVNASGRESLRVETIKIENNRVILKDTFLPEGVNELRLYFAKEISDTLSFPIIRQLIVDTTKPRIAQVTEGRIGTTEIGKPGNIEARQDTNVLRPIPGRDREKRGLPVTPADTLRTQITDNIELPARSGEDTTSAATISIVRNDSVKTDSLHFRMPVLQYPVQFAIKGRTAEGRAILVEEISAPWRDSVGQVMGIEKRPFGVEPVKGNSDTTTGLELRISLPPALKLKEEPPEVNFIFPFALLPAPLRADNVHLTVELRATDGAGNQDSLVLEGGEVRFLIRTGESGGLLVDKAINFPNPFTSLSALGETGTTIRFVLSPQVSPEASVKLRIFDSSGEQVYVADLGGRGAGEHLITWTGYDIYGQPLASGVYFAFLEVRTADRKETNKLKIAILNRKK